MYLHPPLFGYTFYHQCGLEVLFLEGIIFEFFPHLLELVLLAAEVCVHMKMCTRRMPTVCLLCF